MGSRVGGGWLDLNLPAVEELSTLLTTGAEDVVALGGISRLEVGSRLSSVEYLLALPSLFRGLADLYTIFVLFGLGSNPEMPVLDEMVGGVVAGSHLGTWGVWGGEAMGLLVALDPLLILSEIILVLLLCSLSSPLFPLLSHAYSMLVGFCISNGVSAYEVGGLLTTIIGLVLFDLFLTSTEEDLADMASTLILCFIGWSLVLVVLGLGSSLYYSLSPVSGGSVGLRIVLSDIINVALCLLRVVFCWVRYIFYDLQVELVDLSLHYTDEVGSLQFGGWGLYTPLALAIAVQWDMTLVVVQVLLSFFKLVIASFLLWLIVDLFILRPMAWSEVEWAELVCGC